MAEHSHFFILPDTLSAIALIPAAAAAIACWVGAHRISPRFPQVRGVPWLAVRVLVGFVALMLSAQTLEHALAFATAWPLWLILLAGAVLVEALVKLYGFERELLPPRTGTQLVRLRVALALTLLAMLCQPTLTIEHNRTVVRRVAVLLDNSPSMRVRDTGMSPPERLRLAEKLGIKTAQRATRFERIRGECLRMEADLEAQRETLRIPGELEPEARARQVARHSARIQDALESIDNAIAVQTNTLFATILAGAVPTNHPIRAILADLSVTFSATVRKPLADARKTLADLRDKPEQSPALRLTALQNAMALASSNLVALGPRLQAAGDALDTLAYESLGAPARANVDQAALQPRFDLARTLLFDTTASEPWVAKPSGAPWEQISRDYSPRLYTFASRTRAISADTLNKPEQNRKPPGPDANLNEQTDIASALDQVLADTPREELAGILVLTDGRHNASNSVESAARRLGLQNTPVCTALFGDYRKPPVDASIVAVEAPATVAIRDKVFMNVDIKLDGLSGTNVTVTLLDGSNAVASCLVTVAQDSCRSRIQLSDLPATNGVHAYRIVIQSFQDEAALSNNQFYSPVCVADDKIKLLLLEGRPRWEFRYLENLFNNRDTAVQLQYVLFHPDRADQMPDKPIIHASAVRTNAATEATALPENDAEWLKFDAVILGDIEPACLPPDAIKAIHRFVTIRGGTLVIISGPLFMPRAYGGTPLAELLPVTFDSEPRLTTESAQEEQFIRLTSEGRESVLARLEETPKSNIEIWDALPAIRWRLPLRAAKEGAGVLAYASPANPPPDLADNAGTNPAELLKRKRAFERSHALIALHNAGLGKVLFFAFDETWRLRFRHGDRYHHRFWSQIIRWAANDKLPFGTPYVRLGADSPRYRPDSPVRIRARITRRDFSPVVSDRVRINVTSGNGPILQRRMLPVSGMPGSYSSELKPMEMGIYRVELDLPDSADLIEKEGAGPVAAEFAVAGGFPLELIELSADPGLPASIANLTGGTVTDPLHLADALAKFGEPSHTRRERVPHALWSSWPLLLLISTLAATEWFLRKRAKLP